MVALYLIAGMLMANEKIVLAGGCFWCMESPFEKLPGVTSVVSGYMGGSVEKPTYEQVSSGSSGHREVVQIEFDPKKITLDEILMNFWQNVDPTDEGGQFVDRGQQYTTAVFVANEEQRKIAQNSKEAIAKALKKDGKPRFTKSIVTPILDATTFYPAEDYHQDYYKKNPVKYRYYRNGSGRDRKLLEFWPEIKR